MFFAKIQSISINMGQGTRTQPAPYKVSVVNDYYGQQPIETIVSSRAAAAAAMSTQRTVPNAAITMRQGLAQTGGVGGGGGISSGPLKTVLAPRQVMFTLAD